MSQITRVGRQFMDESVVDFKKNPQNSNSLKKYYGFYKSIHFSSHVLKVFMMLFN